MRFLEGNFGWVTERSINISTGKTIFFPLGNYKLGYDELKPQPLDEWLRVKGFVSNPQKKRDRGCPRSRA